jgi:UrcA family protein
MSVKTIVVQASLPLVLAALSMPALAGSLPNTETVVRARQGAGGQTVNVTASDLSDSRAEGALLSRIRAAATNVCGERPLENAPPIAGYNSCVDMLVADARVALPSRTDLSARGGSVNMVLRWGASYGGETVTASAQGMN